MVYRRKSKVLKIVTPEQRNAFLEYNLLTKAASYADEFAAERMPQLEGVEDGDWEKKYKIEDVYPIVPLLRECADKFTSVQQEFYEDERIMWQISNGIDAEDLDQMVEDYANENNPIDLPADQGKVEAYVDIFRAKVLRKVAKAERKSCRDAERDEQAAKAKKARKATMTEREAQAAQSLGADGTLRASP